MQLLLFFFYFLIYLLQHLVFLAVLALWQAGVTQVTACGLPLPWLLLLWNTGLVAPKHVGSSWTRDQTRVPGTGGWILIHSATKEVPISLILMAL